MSSQQRTKNDPFEPWWESESERTERPSETPPPFYEGDGGSSGGSSYKGSPGAAIAGFVVCFILLVIVFILIGYNIYLWRRRKLADKAARQTLVRRPSPSWKKYQEQNGIGGAKRPRRKGQENLGYAHSTGSVSTKGSGLPPTVSLDDITLSDDEEDTNSRDPRDYYTTSNPGDYIDPSWKHDQPAYKNNQPQQNDIKYYPNTPTYRNPYGEHPEIALRPALLQSSYHKEPEDYSSRDNSGYLDESERSTPSYNTNNNNNPLKREANVAKPPRPQLQRNSGLAILSGGELPIDTRTVSFTGIGAQDNPSFSLGTSHVSHSGGLGYHQY